MVLSHIYSVYDVVFLNAHLIFLQADFMTVIVMAHNKGGAGKTTSSVHVVGELKPAKALDLDTHRGLSIIHGLRPEDKQIPISIPETQEELIKEISAFKSTDELLYIDCGGFDSDMTRTAVAFADLVIVPAKDSLPERIGLMSFDSVLGEISEIVGRHIEAHLFLCKTNPNKKHYPKLDALLPTFKHIKLMSSRLSYRTADFEESLESGFGITESLHGRTTAGGKEVRSMVEEILKIVKET